MTSQKPRKPAPGSAGAGPGEDADIAADGLLIGDSPPRRPGVRGIVDLVRSGIEGIGHSLRDEHARVPTGRELIVLAAIVLVPAIITAINLLPELTVPTPNVNDDSVHFLFIQNASNALSSGQNVFDHWDPQFETGVPQFLYYQHLPALAVVAIQRLSFGFLDLLTTFNLVRYVLMVAFPLTVFVSMRTFGFSTVAAALAAAASTLLSGNFRYGFEYDSYTFRGFGLFTQLWAMHLSFLTVASVYAAIHRGRRLWLAALLLGILVLTHVLYAYMVAIAVLVIGIWGISRANLRDRFIRLAVIGGFALAISAYMWWPFLTQTAFLNATPYLQRDKYDSFGANSILSWLVSGDFLDHGRPPVLTFFLGVGIVAAILSRTRLALVTLALFVVWLVLYFGRPTLGPILDLLPLHASLLLHRFAGAVDLAVIALIGIGGAAIWPLYRPQASAIRLGGAALVMACLLAPAIVERTQFFAYNTELKDRTSFAVAVDTDSTAIIDKIETLPKGRVFAGLQATYGKAMALGDVYFYNLLAYHGIESLAPPNESYSLNSDYIWDFNDRSQADFDLWNVRYLIAPTGRDVAPFLTPLLKTTRYTLYQAPTNGYAEYVELVARRAVATQTELFASNLAWERGDTLPAARQYIRYDYPSASPVVGAAAVPGCPDGGSTDYELLQPGKINLVVSCSAASTLVIKTTYHPNWKVVVDGTPVDTFMVSPSFIGISMPAGTHTVDAVYEATPIKLPLQVIGLLALVLLIGLRWRIDAAADRLTAMRSLPRPARSKSRLRGLRKGTPEPEAEA